MKRVTFTRTIGSKHISWEIDVYLTRRKEIKVMKSPKNLFPRIYLWNKFEQGVDKEYDYPGYIKHSTYELKL